jgi:phytoene synthase
MSRPTSFYYSFLVLPRVQRDALVAVWDFCRAVDDTVDERAGFSVEPAASSVQGAGDAVAVRQALQDWRLELERLYSGTPTTPQGVNLQPWIRHFTLSRQPFADLIDGCEMDLDRSRYQTFAELYEYCWRVASTVGLICIEIFGARSAREYAMHLGVALQLTNILRDVGSDLTGGRLYVPLEDLKRFGCTDADLAAGRVTPPIAALLSFQAARARDYYWRAHAALPAGARRSLVAAEIMDAIYRDLLARIERARFDVFSSRISVPRRRQALLAAATWLRSRVGSHGAA